MAVFGIHSRPARCFTLRSRLKNIRCAPSVSEIGVDQALDGRHILCDMPTEGNAVQVLSQPRETGK